MYRRFIDRAWNDLDVLLFSARAKIHLQYTYITLFEVKKCMRVFCPIRHKLDLHERLKHLATKTRHYFLFHIGVKRPIVNEQWTLTCTASTVLCAVRWAIFTRLWWQAGFCMSTTSNHWHMFWTLALDTHDTQTLYLMNTSSSCDTCFLFCWWTFPCIQSQWKQFFQLLSTSPPLLSYPCC